MSRARNARPDLRSLILSKLEPDGNDPGAAVRVNYHMLLLIIRSRLKEETL